MVNEKLMRLVSSLPEVSSPTQKVVPFKEKLKWTLIILGAFFALGMIPLFGLGQNALQQFTLLSVILGAEFGSIISLGIGPIVTASIFLQLFTGAGILKIDLNTPDGKKFFEGLQKLLSIVFIIFEAALYVLMGGLSPVEGPAFGIMRFVLIFQLFLGGMLILFMDEVVSKWGFGSGISIFIAAGVSKSLFISIFSPQKSPTNPDLFIGKIPALIQNFVSGGDFTTTSIIIASILFTALVFMLAVYVQAMKVEIPLSFGRVRGYGIRWPLNFMYTSNIPVILVAALMANIQLFARLFQNMGKPIFGTFVGNSPATGLVAWINAPNVVEKLIIGNLTGTDIAHAATYMLFMICGAVIFSIFWVQTSGMDAASQAKQILASGLQVPGFRRDERVLERLLDRYIKPLTIMGAITVGFIAGFADIAGALSRGTGILLAVMIIYQLYEKIAREHAMDLSPALRKFVKA